MNGPKPTHPEIVAIFTPLLNVNIETWEGMDELNDAFMKKFEHRYTNDELDLGLQDQHFREAFEIYMMLRGGK